MWKNLHIVYPINTLSIEKEVYYQNNWENVNDKFYYGQLIH